MNNRDIQAIIAECRAKPSVMKQIRETVTALLIGEPRLLDRRLGDVRRECDRLAAVENADAKWRRDNLRYFGRQIMLREGR